MSGTLAMRWWGLSFVDPAIERSYRNAAVVEALPFIRLGMTASLGSWALALGCSAVAVPHVAWLLGKWFVALVLPAIAGALVMTWFPRTHRWLFPMAAIANASAGLVVVQTAKVGIPE